jgi:hypothetical protein
MRQEIARPSAAAPPTLSVADIQQQFLQQQQVQQMMSNFMTSSQSNHHQQEQQSGTNNIMMVMNSMPGTNINVSSASFPSGIPSNINDQQQIIPAMMATMLSTPPSARASTNGTDRGNNVNSGSSNIMNALTSLFNGNNAYVSAPASQPTPPSQMQDQQNLALSATIAALLGGVAEQNPSSANGMALSQNNSGNDNSNSGNGNSLGNQILALQQLLQPQQQNSNPRPPQAASGSVPLLQLSGENACSMSSDVSSNSSSTSSRSPNLASAAAVTSSVTQPNTTTVPGDKVAEPFVSVVQSKAAREVALARGSKVIPCRARGMPMDHSGYVSNFWIIIFVFFCIYTPVLQFVLLTSACFSPLLSFRRLFSN